MAENGCAAVLKMCFTRFNESQKSGQDRRVFNFLKGSAISQYNHFESIMDTTETEFSLKSREALPTKHMVPRWTDAIPDCLAAYFY